MSRFSQFRYGQPARNSVDITGRVLGALRCIARRYYYSGQWYYAYVCLACGYEGVRTTSKVKAGKCPHCQATTAPEGIHAPTSAISAVHPVKT